MMLKLGMLLVAVTATAIQSTSSRFPSRSRARRRRPSFQVGSADRHPGAAANVPSAHVAAFVVRCLGRAVGARLGPSPVIEPPSQ